MQGEPVSMSDGEAVVPMPWRLGELAGGLRVTAVERLPEARR